ncbi:MAG: SAM-dependent methyltransferase, partial [Candidatus Limnocylindria bacterium]
AGAPWVAYRHFCEHFLGPLALMAYCDIRYGLLLRNFVDGIPLDLVSATLPGRTRLRLGLLSHVHMHAAAQRRHAGGGREAGERARRTKVSDLGQRALLDSLRRTVEQLRWEPRGTAWADYAENTSYSEPATRAKREVVERFLSDAGGATVWDLGANVGVYSRLAATLGRDVVAFDVDPAAVERHWQALVRDRVGNVLPLIVDLMNPSPSLGWALAERRSLFERANADVVIALALVHHLAIGRNVPLVMLSAFLARLAPHVVIEFVPKEDPMVQVLLATREDVFPDYTLDGFRAAFATHFDFVDEIAIPSSRRIMFHLRRTATRVGPASSVTMRVPTAPPPEPA